jgi:WD40 repeat protein
MHAEQLTQAGQVQHPRDRPGDMVRIWDPATGEQRAVLEEHHDWIQAMCPVTVADRGLLVTAGSGGTVRIWDAETGEQVTALKGRGWRRGMCSVTVAGRELLATSEDRTVQIWDPVTGACRLTVPTYHIALTVQEISGSLAIGLDAGILMIKLNPGAWMEPSRLSER